MQAALEQTKTTSDTALIRGGSVDTQDLFEMLYSCAKSSAGIREDQLEGTAFLAADIDENDALDSTDIYYALLYIAQKSAGLPTSWKSVVQYRIHSYRKRTEKPAVR